MKTLFDYCKRKEADIRGQVRELAKNGETKISVARRFNLKYDKVIYWTRDIKTRKVLPSEIREEVRRRVMEGERKITVSREMGLNPSTVVSWTRDMKRRPINLNLSEPYLSFLNCLIEKGYAFTADHGITSIDRIYRALRNHLPVRRISVRGKWIYYLENRKEDAFKGFVERYGGKVISYRVLSMAGKCFGIGDGTKVSGIVRNIRENKISSD